ncbi:MAG: TIGR01777 family protein [Bacteroidales bacterium]|nr:TIGR01777 family protein [Bacteroidales bacterium]
MKIILIGATGFIGQQLVKNLSSKKHHLTIVSRNKAKAEKIFLNHSDFAGWDGRDPKALTDIINCSDAVINLAGESIAGGRWTDKRKQQILSSRIQSTKAVVNAINEADKKPKVLIQASAVGYYGADNIRTFDENSSAGKGFLADVTVQWEQAAKELDKSVRVVFLRTGVVLDYNGGALPKMAMPFKLGIGGHIGLGKQWFSWIHIDDEVRAIEFLLENENAFGPFNLTAPEPVTMKEFSKTLGKALKRPSWLHVPSFAIKLLMGKMGEEMLLSGQRVVPKKLMELGFTFRYTIVFDALKSIFSPG